LKNQEYRRFEGEKHSYLVFIQLSLRYQLDFYVVVLVTRAQLLYILFRLNVLITSSKFSSCMFVFSNATCWSHIDDYGTSVTCSRLASYATHLVT